MKLKMMRTALVFIFIFIFCRPILLLAQTGTDRLKIQRALDSLSIQLNKPKSPAGFQMSYGCDSVCYFKKVMGDTIVFLTPGSMTPMNYDSPTDVDSFLYWLKTRGNFPPSFPTRFADDGRIEVVDYAQTTFLVENGSLFLLYINQDDFVEDMVKYLSEYSEGKIDSTRFERKTNRAERRNKDIIEKKLLFSPTMFSKENAVKLTLNQNPGNATVVLKRRWKIDNLYAYTIEVTENQKKYTLNYEYSFDQNFRFLKWEGCFE